MQFDGVIGFVEADRALVQMNDVLLEFAGLGGQQVVQVGAMKLVIGRLVQAFVFLGEAETADFLAGVMQPENIGARPNGRLSDGWSQSQIVEHMHGICAHLDAGADFAQHGRLFVNLDIVAGLHQAGSGGQPSQPCAGDENFIAHMCP